MSARYGAQPSSGIVVTRRGDAVLSMVVIAIARLLQHIAPSDMTCVSCLCAVTLPVDVLEVCVCLRLSALREQTRVSFGPDRRVHTA